MQTLEEFEADYATKHHELPEYSARGYTYFVGYEFFTRTPRLNRFINENCSQISHAEVTGRAR